MSGSPLFGYVCSRVGDLWLVASQALVALQRLLLQTMTVVIDARVATAATV